MTPLPETNFEVGTPVEGDISSEGEEDEYTISLFEGRIYVFKTELINLGDSVITVLDTDGQTELAFNDDFPDDAFNFETASRVVFVPPASGVYFVIVAAPSGGFGDGTGTYVLTATEVTTEPITIDTPLEELEISNPGEEDWFTVNLVEGVSYIIITETPLELFDTMLALVDTDGQTQLTFNDDGCRGTVSRLVITVSASGEYFLTVFGFGSLTGTYDLSVTETVLAPPESIAVGSSVEGDISVSCGQDRYLVDLVGGLTYTFEVAPTTLADSILAVLDTNGLTQLDFADDPELIVFTAPASGTYTLVVAAFAEDQLGTYLLTVTQNS